MELPLDKLPKEYLIELFLITGYPKFLDYCRTNPNLNVFCDDKYLWTRLLQQDYYDVVDNYIFTDPRRTYTTIFKAFSNSKFKTLKKKISQLGKLASIDNNLELINVLYFTYSNEMNYKNQKRDMLYYAVENGSFAVATYILQDKSLKFSDNILITNYYMTSNKLGTKGFLNTMLKDERFDKGVLLNQAIDHYDINTVKLLVDEFNANITFKYASGTNIEVVIYLLDNFNISKDTIEEAIIKLNKYNKNDTLKLLLETNNYDSNILFERLSKDQVLDTIKYLLEHNEISVKSLNIASVNAVRYCNLKLLGLIMEQKAFNPLFGNSRIILEASKDCVSHIINKFVTYQNYDKVLIDIAKHNNILNHALEPLLNSKFLGRKNKKNKDLLQNILLLLLNNRNNVNEDNVVSVLSKLDKLDDDILQESSRIAIERNLLKIINKLIDWNINNINELFNEAIDYGNIMAAVMISNYDICEYINDERVINFLQQYIKNTEYYNDCDALYQYIDFQFYDLIKKGVIPLDEENEELVYNFVNKYDTYLTEKKVNNMISDMLEEISADRYDDY